MNHWRDELHESLIEKGKMGAIGGTSYTSP